MGDKEDVFLSSVSNYKEGGGDTIVQSTLAFILIMSRIWLLFLGLYLADLVFNSELPSIVDPKTSTSLEEAEFGLGSTSGPLVNIHKHRTTATIIKRVLTFRTMTARYPFQPEPEVQEVLRTIQGLDSAELLRLSNQCEERASDMVRG